MFVPHPVFPLGMLCAHCQEWDHLEKAITHRLTQHEWCRSCRIELVLAEALLDEAQQSLKLVQEARA